VRLQQFWWIPELAALKQLCIDICALWTQLVGLLVAVYMQRSCVVNEECTVH